MPNYLYKCPKCNKEKTVNKPMDRSNEKEICICGNEMKKQMGTLGFFINGGIMNGESNEQK